MSTPDDPADSQKPVTVPTVEGAYQVPAEVARASGMKKLDWIFSLPSVDGFVRSLAPQELYRWMSDIGKEDAYPLLEFAEPEQLQALVDIDAWTRRELSVPRLLEWLDLALAVDTDTAGKLLTSQDDSTLEWLFTGDVQVLPADTDVNVIPDELAFFSTPDFMYVVTVPREHPLEDRMPQLLKLLWSADTDRARLLFQQAQFELHESTADEAERFRAARLNDLGFEPYDEAISVFEVIEAGKLREAIAADLAPGPDHVAANIEQVAFPLSLSDAKAPELLSQAVATLGERDRNEFARGFAYLSNKVFMAETGDLSRLDDLPEYARYAAALANLGLSYLSQEDPERASQVLVKVSPELLFKAGWTLVFAMSKKARRVAKRAGLEQGFGLFGAPTDEALYAAQLVRPLFPELLDDAQSLGHRPIATLEDISKIEAYLSHASELLDAFEERFGVTIDALQHAESLALSKDARKRIRLTTLVRTGLANLLVSDQFSFSPLDRQTIATFASAALDKDGGLTPLMRETLAGLGAAGASTALGRLVERATEELVESMGSTDRDVDLRYAGELFLVRGA